MTPRQAYALAHPVNSPRLPPAEIRRLHAQRRHARGFLLDSMLAVDR